MINSPWAILLCKFNDDSREPYPLSRYQDLFTRSGIGKFGMVDFFADMSHGKLNLADSQVFGWWTLDQARADYQGWNTVPGSRDAIITWAREKAAAEGVDLSRFHSVVVCLNVDTDLFGSPYGVCCDDGRWDHDAVPGFSSLSPCILGQEMGHGYGLNHSRIEGGDDYSDGWDIMTTAVTSFMAPHPVFTELDVRGRPVFRIGPGLNAANMAYKGWLDEARVWTAPDGPAFDTEVALRPLHRRDLPGHLAIRFGDYFIEFRMNDRWDAAIPQPCVLVHRLEDGISYLQPDNAGNPSLTTGSWLGTAPGFSVLGSGQRIFVRSIDPVTQTARIGLRRTLPQIDRQWPLEGPYRNPGVAWLEEAATIRFSDRILTIPKVSLSYTLLRKIALMEDSRTIPAPGLRQAVQREALTALADTARSRVAAMHRITGTQRPLLLEPKVALPPARSQKG